MKIMSKQLGRIFGMVILVSLALSACSGGGAVSATPTPLPTVVANSNIVAEGRVVPADDVQLSFLSAGQVEEVLVEEGDVVKTGDVVARLKNKEQLEAQIAGAQAELVAAQQARQKLDDDQAQAQAAAADTLAATNKALKDAQYQLDNFTVPPVTASSRIATSLPPTIRVRIARKTWITPRPITTPPSAGCSSRPTSRTPRPAWIRPWTITTLWAKAPTPIWWRLPMPA
jgi:hypothetical protein